MFFFFRSMLQGEPQNRNGGWWDENDIIGNELPFLGQYVCHKFKSGNIICLLDLNWKGPSRCNFFFFHAIFSSFTNIPFFNCSNAKSNKDGIKNKMCPHNVLALAVKSCHVYFPKIKHYSSITQCFKIKHYSIQTNIQHNIAPPDS